MYICLLCFFAVGVADDKPKSKKFEVVLTVKYNAITLEEAAQKEKEFRARYSDACKVDITLKKADEGEFTLSTGSWFDAPDAIFVEGDSLIIGTLD